VEVEGDKAGPGHTGALFSFPLHFYPFSSTRGAFLFSGSITFRVRLARWRLVSICIIRRPFMQLSRSMKTDTGFDLLMVSIGSSAGFLLVYRCPFCSANAWDRTKKRRPVRNSLKSAKECGSTCSATLLFRAVCQRAGGTSHGANSNQPRHRSAWWSWCG